MVKYSLQTAAILAALLLSGCNHTPPAAQAEPDGRADAEAAIRKADADWAKAGQSRNVDAWMAFYTDDAVILPPNEPMATGKENVRKSIAGLLSLPDLSLTWQAQKVEAAQSGDIGYLYGTYDMKASDGKGKPITDKGKILEIWKKQADGSWKCIVDTWNSDLPAPPPAK
jgi:ketosteroid isomerase-like protein